MCEILQDITIFWVIRLLSFTPFCDPIKDRDGQEDDPSRMPDAHGRAEDQEDHHREHRIAEDVRLAPDDRLDQRVVQRDGQENYPAPSPAAHDVERAEQYVRDNGDDGIRQLLPEIAVLKSQHFLFAES